jgi:uncharacterized phage protein (TIGR02220 family)
MLKKFTTEFTVTPNEILNHPKMSLKAKGIWGFLNSKPQNWKFSVARIAKQNKDGDDGITSGLKELEKNRYLKRVAKKDETGQWNGYEYHLFDQPYPITVSGKTGNGKTVNGKTVDGKSPTLSNTINSKKEDSKKEKQNGLFETNAIPDIPSEVLKYLNDKKPTNREFEFTASNLSDIKTRIKEKFKLEDFKKVIDYKIKEWNKPEMKKYIRPSTLFGKRFNEYLIQAENAESKSDGSNNFKYNPTQKAELK